MTGRTGLIVITVALSAALLALGCKKPAADQAASPEKSTSSVGKPIITAVESEFNFGRVKQGEEVEHLYKIKNTGDRDLVIEKTTGS